MSLNNILKEKEPFSHEPSNFSLLNLINTP